MCGICGFMTQQGNNRLTTTEGVADMFSATDTRGRDAAGFAASVKGQLFRIRQDNSSTRLLGKVTTLLVDESKAWVGHCRLQTQGPARIMDNNHPFVQDGLALIHNGIIWNYDEYLDKRVGHVKTKGTCDSELIIQSINYHRSKGKSITQSIQHMSRELDGDMACALISRKGQLWLWRREEGASSWGSTPLEIALHPQGQGVHFASTRNCLEKSLIGKDDWDFSRLDKHTGIHFWLQRGEVKTRTFTMPECENPVTTYSQYYWPSNDSPSSSHMHLNISSGITKLETCDRCGERLIDVSSHVCEDDEFLTEYTAPFCLIRTIESSTYIVKYPQYEHDKEDVLYTCQNTDCREVLVHDELMQHRQSLSHYQYLEETGI